MDELIDVLRKTSKEILVKEGFVSPIVFSVKGGVVW
jgi:hypothetical protein